MGVTKTYYLPYRRNESIILCRPGLLRIHPNQTHDPVHTSMPLRMPEKMNKALKTCGLNLQTHMKGHDTTTVLFMHCERGLGIPGFVLTCNHEYVHARSCRYSGGV